MCMSSDYIVEFKIAISFLFSRINYSLCFTKYGYDIHILWSNDIYSLMRVLGKMDSADMFVLDITLSVTALFVGVNGVKFAVTQTSNVTLNGYHMAQYIYFGKSVSRGLFTALGKLPKWALLRFWIHWWFDVDPDLCRHMASLGHND